MSQVFVALGSNLGVSDNLVSDALSKIEKLPTTSGLRTSRWYRTQAIGGPADQPDYLNAVCAFETQLDPLALLRALQRIEAEAGRTREVRWGPRTLDLDIIWVENFHSDTATLTVPHPRAHERAFVLQPLVDLNADFHLQGKAITEWLKSVSDQNIQVI